MDIGITGKSVLITGAAKGIGRAVASAFAAEKCVLHLADWMLEDLENVRTELSARHGAKIHLHSGDLSTSQSMIDLAHACGRIDILVNNAGDLPAGTLETLGDDSWRRGFDLKVFGYITLSREIYAAMKAQGGGVIINNIGNSGENWDYDYIAGSTGNAALMSFTKAIGGISLDYGVRVVGVNPGPVATDRLVKVMKNRALDHLGDASRWKEFTENFPGGRMAEPEEIANLILFLSSSHARYISGAIVTIDGGISARGSIAKSSPRSTHLK